ncbi:putative membrane protein, partial [Vibrio parahaemolyticus Peru-288]
MYLYIQFRLVNIIY